MFIAQVTGSVVATQKTATMTGHKLLVVEPYRLDEKTRSSLVSTGRTFIAVDTLGAGDGFIAGFLVAHLGGAPLADALDAGAAFAAAVCGWQGAFGHARPWSGPRD